MRYILEPEVSGELGDHTIIETRVHPPIVTQLHFIFKGWLGDDLIECFPVYLISERLRQSLTETDLTGYDLENCEIEVSEEMQALHSNTKLPAFFWLKIVGKMVDSDFSMNTTNRLSISEQAYQVLSQFNLSHCDFNKVM